MVKLALGHHHEASRAAGHHLSCRDRDDPHVPLCVRRCRFSDVCREGGRWGLANQVERRGAGAHIGRGGCRSVARGRLRMYQLGSAVALISQYMVWNHGIQGHWEDRTHTLSIMIPHPVVIVSVGQKVSMQRRR